MLILLPPSETKHQGGRPEPLALNALALPELAPQREAVIDALVALSADEERAVRVLKLGVRQRGEVAHNAALRDAPTMPAVDRYTGVLFDALAATDLDDAGRRWMGEHVLIHSAPFGPVGALDAIPTYRLSANAALPGVPPLRRHWSRPTSAALAAASASFVLDLRSEAYAALGPVPEGVPAVYIRVVTEGGEGTVRALNHFNKSAKGRLVRALSLSRPALSSGEELVEWGQARGLALRPGAAGELQLIV